MLPGRLAASMPLETWFADFNQNWLVGMLGLDLSILLSYLALVPAVLALYIALRPQNESVMLISAALDLIAIAPYPAANRIFEMLALSQQYAATTTEAERRCYAPPDRAILTTYLGSAAMPAELVGWNSRARPSISASFNISFVLLVARRPAASCTRGGRRAFSTPAGGDLE